jgi:hypothetical protein
MDYLPHPRVQQDAIQVPMLLGCTGYDHLSFEGFPARCGWDLTKMLKAELDGKEPSTAAAFIQQWLYFGVIATAFSVAGIPFILSEFLLAQDGLTIARYLAHAPRSDRQRIRAVIRSLERHDSPVAPDQLHAPGKPLPLFVTGKPLVAGLQNLEAKERSASEEQRGEGFGRINRAVDTALRVIRPLSEAISTAGGDGNHDQHDLLRAILPGEIELSIVLLMETIKYKMVTQSPATSQRMAVQQNGRLWVVSSVSVRPVASVWDALHLLQLSAGGHPRRRLRPLQMPRATLPGE